MKIFSCIILLLVAAESHGLHLFLNRSTSGLSLCGTLTCMEGVSSTDVNGADPATTYSDPKITSMSIYRKKAVPNGLAGNFDDRDEGALLVTLTDTLITVMDSALDIVYGGHLTESAATLRLGLLSLESCRSEYTCKVFQTDLSGVEQVNELSTNIDNRPQTDQCPSDSYMPNVIEPQSCEKDMIPVQFQPLFPYLVVNPNVDSAAQVPVVCETHTLGGGWIVFQRRSSGNVDFNRGWEDYKKGFGFPGDDFWLGLDTIHSITSSGTYELQVDLVIEGLHYYAHYETFYISAEADSYKVLLGAYDGTAYDSFSDNHGSRFSTYDNVVSFNCAESYKGGWWYTTDTICGDTNLNGPWLDQRDGAFWKHDTDTYPASFTQMMIRKINEPLV